MQASVVLENSQNNVALECEYAKVKTLENRFLKQPSQRQCHLLFEMMRNHAPLEDIELPIPLEDLMPAPEREPLAAIAECSVIEEEEEIELPAPVMLMDTGVSPFANPEPKPVERISVALCTEPLQVSDAAVNTSTVDPEPLILADIGTGTTVVCTRSATVSPMLVAADIALSPIKPVTVHVPVHRTPEAAQEVVKTATPEMIRAPDPAVSGPWDSTPNLRRQLELQQGWDVGRIFPGKYKIPTKASDLFSKEKKRLKR
ncbi:hypothetical protein J8273_0225 [Carpediemonas membranifera]|uniref:Uncharacterized protein n=1 Tax=Carpediemonas membranifera TaxID=201153 RepID=A0A8J6B3M2_9EUKA|nr:hypothetical protein J8273_0225 [Carpediemonas membranifera]|eukprot:KAG9395013.1 hypothetical protein J8273_0225 [Carpediemonas membranifera]